MTPEEKESYAWCWDRASYYEKRYRELRLLIRNATSYENLIDYIDTELELHKVRRCKTQLDYDNLLKEYD